MTLGATVGWAIVLPLLGALGVAATGRRPNLRESVTVLTTLLTFGAVVRLLGPVMAGERPELALGEVVPGLRIAFAVEPLGMLFALVASGLWIVTALYSIGYMRGHDEPHQTRFYACFALAIAFALGIAFAGNLFTLFLFYEAMTLGTYPLVTHHGTPEARRAGRLYLGILMSTSIGLLLVAMVWIYDLAGTLDFQPGGILEGHIEGLPLAILLGLVAFGTGKAALMPFHRWLPAAMVAPTPVSALLHAVAVVKAGVFTVLKLVVYIFGIDHLRTQGASEWLMAVAAATLVIAAVVAIHQDNLKRRLAYSTISQLAYIVLGAALVSEAAVRGAALHIAMHALGKITLFFCAGAFYVVAHTSRVSELGGMARRMPWTVGAFFVGSLSVIGVPPAGGTWSKLLLARGTIEANAQPALWIYMASSLLAIGYLMPVVLRACTPGDEAAAGADAGAAVLASDLRRAPLMVAPLVLTAAGCLLAFFFVEPLDRLLSGIFR